MARLGSRLTWVATGIAWAIGSGAQLAGAQSWSPVTALDWLAVWTFTTAWLLLAPAILFVAGLAPRRSIVLVASVVALGAAAAGIANAIEDGLDVDAVGTLYVVGSMTALLGVAVLAAVIARVGAPALAGWTAGLAAAMFLYVAGGGFVILALFGFLARRPARLIARAPQPLPGSASP